jgi:hypothetical protein
MGASARWQIEVTTSTNSTLEAPGQAAPLPGCGKIRSYGHLAGDRVHAEARVFRCHRFSCSSCWDQPSGWADRAASRIQAGILKDTTDQEDSVGEFLILFRCDLELFSDPAFIRRAVDRFRARLGGAVIPPGAWIRHTGNEHDDAGNQWCPVDPHLHVFVRVGPDLPRELGLGVRFQGRDRIPGLEAQLRRARQLTVSSPGMADRKVPIVGWFGRKIVRSKDPAPTAPPVELAQTRFCEICKEHIPKESWYRVISRRAVVEKEGFWEADSGSVTFPGRDKFVLRRDRY